MFYSNDSWKFKTNSYLLVLNMVFSMKLLAALALAFMAFTTATSSHSSTQHSPASATSPPPSAGVWGPGSATPWYPSPSSSSQVTVSQPPSTTTTTTSQSSLSSPTPTPTNTAGYVQVYSSANCENPLFSSNILVYQNCGNCINVPAGNVLNSILLDKTVVNTAGRAPRDVSPVDPYYHLTCNVYPNANCTGTKNRVGIEDGYTSGCSNRTSKLSFECYYGCNHPIVRN